jgi:hypothetical protein
MFMSFLPLGKCLHASEFVSACEVPLSYIGPGEVQRGEYLWVGLPASPRAPEDFDIALSLCPRRGCRNDGRLFRRLIFGRGLVLAQSGGRSYFCFGSKRRAEDEVVAELDLREE